MNRVAILYLLAELGPVITFFVLGQITTFAAAVSGLMVTTVAATILSWRLERHLPVLPILSCFTVLVGGAITLLYDAPDAIIFSDTVYYVVVASVLAYLHWSGNLIFKKLFGRVFAMTDQGWRVLTRNWLIVLVLAAAANEVVRIFATPDFWIEYRFYKTIFIALFAASQFYVSHHYRIPSESNTWGIRTTSHETVEATQK